MVKSETRRDPEILVRNPSPRLFGEKFRDSKKVKANHEKTRLGDLSKTLPKFRDPAKIFRDPRFSRYHSPPLQFSPKLKGGPGLLGPLPWIHHWPVPVPVYEHHSKNDMFFFISSSWSRCIFFVHRNACGNPAEVPILFLFCFACCLFVFFFNRAFLHDHSQVILVFPSLNKANKTINSIQFSLKFIFFSEQSFYRNYSTLDSHTNTVLSHAFAYSSRWR